MKDSKAVWCTVEQAKAISSGLGNFSPSLDRKTVEKFFPLLVTMQLQKRRDSHSTFADTCMLFSCMFMMASEILTSIGSMTDSMLNGPSNLSATRSIASVKTQSSHSLKEGIPLGDSGRLEEWVLNAPEQEPVGTCGSETVKPAGQLPSYQKCLPILLPP